MSRDLAERIMCETGVFPESIMDRNARPVTISGEPFSAELYNEWKAASGLYKGGIPEDVEKRIRDISKLFEIVQEAAITRNRGFPLLYFFDQWLAGAVERFGLSEAINRVKKEQGFNEWDMPIPILKFEKGKRITRLTVRHGQSEETIFNKSSRRPVPPPAKKPARKRPAKSKTKP
jgi:hypothetical protein